MLVIEAMEDSRSRPDDQCPGASRRNSSKKFRIRASASTVWKRTWCEKA